MSITSSKMLSSRSRIVAAVFAIALGSLAASSVPAGSAHASSCTYHPSLNHADDYAVTTALSTCTQVAVRHLYDPVWSSTNYWTGWDYDDNRAASTPTAELVYGQHNGW